MRSLEDRQAERGGSGATPTSPLDIIGQLKNYSPTPLERLQVKQRVGALAGATNCVTSSHLRRRILNANQSGSQIHHNHNHQLQLQLLLLPSSQKLHHTGEGKRPIWKGSSNTVAAYSSAPLQSNGAKSTNANAKNNHTQNRTVPITQNGATISGNEKQTNCTKQKLTCCLASANQAIANSLSDLSAASHLAHLQRKPAQSHANQVLFSKKQQAQSSSQAKHCSANQGRPSPSPATTNSRLRQAALYARRQYHITASTPISRQLVNRQQQPTSSSSQSSSSSAAQRRSTLAAVSSGAKLTVSSCSTRSSARPSQVRPSSGLTGQQQKSVQSSVRLNSIDSIQRLIENSRKQQQRLIGNHRRSQNSTSSSRSTSAGEFSSASSTSSLAQLTVAKRSKPSYAQQPQQQQQQQQQVSATALISARNPIRRSSYPQRPPTSGKSPPTASSHAANQRRPSSGSISIASGAIRVGEDCGERRGSGNRLAAGAYLVQVPTARRGASENSAARGSESLSGRTFASQQRSTRASSANNTRTPVAVDKTTDSTSTSFANQPAEDNHHLVARHQLIQENDTNSDSNTTYSNAALAANPQEQQLEAAVAFKGETNRRPHEEPAMATSATKLPLLVNNNIENQQHQTGKQPLLIDHLGNNKSTSEPLDQQMLLEPPPITRPTSDLDIDHDDEGRQLETAEDRETTLSRSPHDDSHPQNEPIKRVKAEAAPAATVAALELQVGRPTGKLLVAPPEVPIRMEPISDFYDLEARPFARAKCIKKRRRLVDIRHEILLEIEALKLSYYTDRIVKLYEVYETPTEMILILEMANGGELQRVLDDEEQIDERIAKRMVRQILDGLVQLHQSEIAHLDIKPQNILLTELYPNGDIKLCDFGISRRITKDCEIREICGTPDYVAPEILRYDPISLATDMWSLGVLTYVLLSGYSPFGSENKQETFCNITQANLEFPREIFEKVSDDAINFMQKLILRDPSERLTSQQARNHNWLASSY